MNNNMTTPRPEPGKYITTTAPVTRIVGEIIYTIPAGLTGLGLESDSTPDDEWIRIRQFMYVDSMGWRHEIEVYCDPDHADPWHAFTIEEVQNG